jgi:hypothetical protein
MQLYPASASLRLRLLLWIFCVAVLPLRSAAKTPAGVLDAGYAPALATADHFLQAWQSGDAENGIALLTSRAKQAATADGIDRFFSAAAPSAYEIGRGKLLKYGRYEFPVVLVGAANKHSRQRSSSIIVLNSGDNDWAVDKLP